MTTQVADPRVAVLAEIEACEESFPRFLRHVKIRDANKGIIPFELWSHTIAVAERWQSGVSCMEGKSRQLGFSWELAAYDLWVLLFRQQARILSISLGERESIELLEKVKFIHKELPPFLRALPAVSNQQSFGIEETESLMMALPSTKNAGRSFQASIVQFDEFAFHPFAGENYDSTRAAVADGGQMLIVTTGNGATGMFAEMWGDPDVPLEKHFTGWSSRPDRNQEWYDTERSAYIRRGRAMFFQRENPDTVEEMFTAFVGLVYGPDENRGFTGFSDERHVRGFDFTWEQSRYRVAGIDPGQGDPFAIIPIGMSRSGHKHQFGEFYEQEGVAYDEVLEYLMQWQRRSPFDAIWVDWQEGTLITTLRRKGLPAMPANKERSVGISVVRSHIEAGDFDIEPHCENTIREYKSYQWSQRRMAGEAETYSTSTPIDHHADAMDATRYALVGLSKGFARTPGAPPPMTAAPDERPKVDFAHHDPCFARGSGKRPGPDYRPGRR